MTSHYGASNELLLAAMQIESERRRARAQATVARVSRGLVGSLATVASLLAIYDLSLLVLAGPR